MEMGDLGYKTSYPALYLLLILFFVLDTMYS
jgi:hypothetical protein